MKRLFLKRLTYFIFITIWLLEGAVLNAQEDSLNPGVNQSYKTKASGPFLTYFERKDREEVQWNCQ